MFQSRYSLSFIGFESRNKIYEFYIFFNSNDFKIYYFDTLLWHRESSSNTVKVLRTRNLVSWRLPKILQLYPTLFYKSTSRSCKMRGLYPSVVGRGKGSRRFSLNRTPTLTFSGMKIPLVPVKSVGTSKNPSGPDNRLVNL